MKLTIKGNPEEIKKVLQAISSSEEHENKTNLEIANIYRIIDDLARSKKS